MNLPRSKSTLIIGAVVIVTIIFLIVSSLSNNQPSGGSEETTKTEITPTTTPTWDPNDPNIPSPMPVDGQSQALTAIQGFLQAYATQSWTDSPATAWIERTRPFVTSRYFAELNAAFAGDGAWAKFVREKTQTTVNVETIEIIQTNAITQGKVIAKAVYQVTTSQDQIATLPETFTRMLTLRQTADQADQWAVDAMTDFVAGAPAPSKAPVTPPAVPPTIKD